MRAPILITDLDWFQFLATQPGLDEVNFWRPSDTRRPQLQVGTPVLFKLRKRHGGWIVGYGIFARHDVLPAWLAWDAFEDRNGAATFGEMRERIERLRHDAGEASAAQGEYRIGCLMLAQPVFLPRASWIRPPSDWPDNVVQGMAYDLDAGEGARVWQELRVQLAAIGRPLTDEAADAQSDRYGQPALVRPRLGQGIFRLAVTGAYQQACAVTGEHSLPALDAAHIRPFGVGGEHDVRNGLLLRSDIHRLFDKGYVGVTPDYRFVVSDRLRDDYSNGHSYYPHRDREIRRPPAVAEWPDPSHLEWHLKHVFRG